MVVFGRGQSGKAVAVESGQFFTVELESNPGTGYKWNWQLKPDPALVKLEREIHRPRSCEARLIGGGGVDVWTFRALMPGYTALELEYRRPWENKPPQARFTLEIAIN